MFNVLIGFDQGLGSPSRLCCYQTAVALAEGSSLKAERATRQVWVKYNTCVLKKWVSVGNPDG